MGFSSGSGGSTGGVGSSSTASQLQLGALVLATLAVGAAGWRLGLPSPRGGGKEEAGRGPGSGPGWRATNLRDLRHFEVEEVLSDEASPAPDGFTVFLGRFAWQAPEERALVKLRPQHLPSGSAAFARAKQQQQGQGGGGGASKGAAGSRSIGNGNGKGGQSLLGLLPSLRLEVQLESGAEYGYYLGKASPLRLWALRLPLTYNVEVIAPASERQVVRARVEEKFLVRETAAMYAQALGPLAAEIRRDGRSIQWVHNILEHKKEAERIVFEDPDPATGFLLVPDPKWKTHPDPLAEAPDRAAWRHAPWTGQLACLAICHDRTIGSLRDLRRRHLPLLRNILTQGLAAIERVYGVAPERVRVFVHYVPQFFHFHVHFSRVHVSYGVEVERAHLLADVIDNIERGYGSGKEYYEEATLTYAVKRSEEVYQRMEAAGVYRAP